MSRTWADRLLGALNADPDLDATELDATHPGDLETNADRPGPWDPPAGAVPDNVVVAALIGHPTSHDVDLILNDPTALRQLAEHWTRNPPSDAILDQARHNPQLSDLLSAASHTSAQPALDVHRGTTQGGSERPDISPADRPTPAPSDARLTGRAVSDLHDGGRNGSIGVWPNRRRRVGRVVLTLVAAAVVALLILMLGGSSVYLYQIDRSLTANITREIDLPPEVTAGGMRPTKDSEAVQTLDYLLIGTDDGNPDVDRDGRSDSVMLLHLNQARDQAYLISFPRTTLVRVPGYGQQKINIAFEKGGAPLVVRTLEGLTGARVDHVAMVDLQGLVSLTQDLGGVTVRNKTAFTALGYTYPAGNITLSGEAALMYVRERHALPGGELDRAENQRNVFKAILAKGLSPEVVSDPFQFTDFLGNAAKRIKVDKSLTNAELRATATSLRMKPSDIALISAPVGNEGVAKGQKVYQIDQRRLTELSQALRQDTMAQYVKKYPEG